MDRAEHLQWCKDRALGYVDQGDLEQAFASFISDVGKHPETEAVSKLVRELGFPMLMSGFLNTPALMRSHIEGYN